MRIPALIMLAATLAGAQSAPSRKGIPAIAKTANGAVVSIVMSDKDGNPIAQGSGFLVNSDGLILTNYHVIAQGTSAVVKLPDGAFFVVDGVLAFDKARDVALIKAHGEDFRTLTLGNSDRVEVGQEVVAIGNPLSLESTVSNGIVSGIRTDADLGGKFLQVTTPISPGSSGGPLFSMGGKVVGITTLYLKGGENLNFAIPINDAKHLLFLARSAKPQAFPNESEPTEAQAQDENSSTPASQTNPTARDYYKQLYDAGGFSGVSNGYVCFDEAPQSVGFLVIQAIAYDEAYEKAFDKATQIMFTKDWREDPEKVKEFQSAVNAEGEIQKQWPYVSFVGDDFFQPGIPADVQKFLRGGGRILRMDWYSRGVKNGPGEEYHWNGNSWIFQIVEATPIGPQTSIYTLSIEPTTMRYLMTLSMTVADKSGLTPPSSVTKPILQGVCEKIPAKQ
ncbi:MAG TPA: trypsin-like peptidase domain-containing protein [Candidatus Acidoferrales bacterium]|nr:trypsin-like peptidase domain-containing protein [Candidatus Acidoferrales bacterium]